MEVPMRILRRACSAFSFLVLASVVSTCGHPPSGVPRHPDTGCRHTVQYWVDPEFTPDQTLTVVQSVFAWQEGSSRAVCFVYGTGGLRIRRAHDPIVAKRVEDLGAVSNRVRPEEVVGLADFPDAYILTEKLRTEQDLFATSVHEVGHLLGLTHASPGGGCDPDSPDGGPGEPSWMYPSINMDPKDTRQIPPRDVRALLALERWR